MNLDDQIKIILDNPDIKKVALPILPLSNIVEKLESYGFSHKDGSGETNGRDVDFWEYFEQEKLGTYTLAGSLWYGEYQFYKRMI